MLSPCSCLRAPGSSALRGRTWEPSVSQHLSLEAGTVSPQHGSSHRVMEPTQTPGKGTRTLPLDEKSVKEFVSTINPPHCSFSSPLPCPLHLLLLLSGTPSWALTYPSLSPQCLYTFVGAVACLEWSFFCLAPKTSPSHWPSLLTSSSYPWVVINSVPHGQVRSPLPRTQDVGRSIYIWPPTRMWEPWVGRH